MSLHADGSLMTSSFVQTVTAIVVALLSLGEPASVPQWIIAAMAIVNVVIHIVNAYRHWTRKGDEEDS